MIERRAMLLSTISLPHPVRVAIDGIDGAGESHRADA
jgi:hypothetical protein